MVALNPRVSDATCNGHSPKVKHVATHRSKDTFSPPVFVVLCTCLNYGVVLFFQCLRELLYFLHLADPLCAQEKNRPGYAPLYQNVDSFFYKFYRRFWDIWQRPIAGVPGPYIGVMGRVAEFRLGGPTFRAINMGSYNYLGFAESGDVCSEAVIRSIREYGAGVGSPRSELGTLSIHHELESTMAWYMGTEDCLVIGMGFATNSTCIPSLVGPGCLILSDELNHASITLGCKLSGATVRTFRHNNIVHLEKKLTEAVAIRGRQWRKILIIMEGVYSMEGTIVNLPEIIRLKKRFHAYLYLDEAHSTGSLGPNGRGVVDYHNCDPRDVDILMGTFTKSFSAAGGYVAGRHAIIEHLRRTSYSFSYATSMAAPIAQQILEALKVISGIKVKGEGKLRLERLARNTRYFRRRLQQMGFVVYGNPNSPVVPVMLFLLSNVMAFVRLMEQRGVAVICVCYPVVPLLEPRVRFCLSSAHCRDMLDNVLDAVSDIGDLLRLKRLKPDTDSESIEY